MELTDMRYDEISYPNAAQFVNVKMDSNCAGDHIIRWNLKMKNGDALTLEQTIRIDLMKTVQ